MIRFQCDYQEGAHPSILKKMEETNYEQTVGYGNDPYCESARKKIRELCNAPEADVHFLVGGTQTNFTVISAILRPYQGALAAVSGHINVHETGAIEATGHKVLALPSEDGKITAAQIREAYEAHWNDADHEHIVQPGMVYISHPTENGTLYVFYIGGTKVGALFGEAVVITNPALKKDFRYLIKQHGGMLAKGRLLGIQFDVLFTDNLYFDIAKGADELAMRLKAAFLEKGYGLRYDSYTNQQFPILPNEHLEKLKEKYSYGFWEAVDDSHSAVRFCTSWATKKEAVDALIADIEAL